MFEFDYGTKCRLDANAHVSLTIYIDWLVNLTQKRLKIVNDIFDATDKQKKSDYKKTYKLPELTRLSLKNINTGTTSNVAENSGGYLTTHS